MSLLFRVIFAAKAKSTHHKIALDALRHLRGALSDQWVDAFLYNADAYLTGAKAPDDKFKDFKNHVMHVEENYWGGAVESAKNWYDRTVGALRDRKWQEGAYSAGVLSHYFTDPFMPLHTGQSEAEGPVHRPLEWSVTKSYEELQNLLIDHLGGYPEVHAPEGDDWLGAMIRAGARAAHVHYDALIDHYNVPLGVKDPPRGLDQECRERIAPLIGQATVGFARVLERAFEEADVSPPLVSVSVPGFLESLDMPFQWVASKIHDSRERAVVEAMYREFSNTGKVIHALPEDDKAVRRMHAEEVLKIPLAMLDASPARAPGSQHGTGAAGKSICNWPVTSREASTTAIVPSRKPKHKPESKKKERIEKFVLPAAAKPASAAPLPAVSVPTPAPVVPPKEVVTGPTTLKLSGAKPSQREEPQKPVQEILREVKGTEKKAYLEKKPETTASALEAPLVPAEPEKKKRGWKTWMSFFKRGAKGKGTAKDEQSSNENAAKSQREDTDADVEFVAAETDDKSDHAPAPLLSAKRPAADVRRTLPLREKQPPVVEAAPEEQEPAAELAPSASLKFRLHSGDPVVDAPSIGQKTARRMEAIGIKTVADFLNMNVEEASQKMGLKHLDPKTLREWQAQTRLALRIPNLRGHDAQILVGCGFKEPEQVARAKLDDLAEKVASFCATSDGERILRSGPKPDSDEIALWIAWAKSSRPLKAA